MRDYLNVLDVRESWTNEELEVDRFNEVLCLGGDDELVMNK